MFFFIILPHLARPITVVIMIETIFLLSVFAEILVTTNGGPGRRVDESAVPRYKTALLDFDVGGGSAGGIVAGVILANVVAVFGWRRAFADPSLSLFLRTLLISGRGGRRAGGGFFSWPADGARTPWTELAAAGEIVAR